MSEPLSAAEEAKLRRDIEAARTLTGSPVPPLVARLVATLDAERAASERPPVDPLREALQARWDSLGPDNDPVMKDSDVASFYLPIGVVRAALASPAAPRPEGLDVREMSRFLQTAWTEADHATDGQPVTAFYDDLARRVVSAFLLPEGLDVERLARALEAVWIAGSDAELTHVSNPHPRLAERIAREYARLSSSVVTVNDDGTADVAEAS